MYVTLGPMVICGIIIYLLLLQVYGLAVMKTGDSFQTLSMATALFIFSAVSHHAFRRSMNVEGFVYIESFFIFLYVAILITTRFAIAEGSEKRASEMLFRQRIKVLFWPLYLGACMIFTLFFFYPM